MPVNVVWIYIKVLFLVPKQPNFTVSVVGSGMGQTPLFVFTKIFFLKKRDGVFLSFYLPLPLGLLVK